MGLSFVGVGLALLGGCSGSAPAPEVSAYVEPGWMAQARQQVEEYQSAMLACLAEHGVQGIVAIGGPVATGGVTDADGNLPAGVQELQEAASKDCNGRVALPALWSAPADDAAYQRMLQVRECVLAQGYEVGEAPSEETWKEQAASGTAWSAYQELIGPGVTRIPDADLRALMEACPQIGQGLQAYIGDDAFG